MSWKVFWRTITLDARCAIRCRYATHSQRLDLEDASGIPLHHQEYSKNTNRRARARETQGTTQGLRRNAQRVAVSYLAVVASEQGTAEHLPGARRILFSTEHVMATGKRVLYFAGNG
jgi:hypothetical protein